MSYSVIPGLCESLKRRLTKLSEGEYGIEETVRLFEVLNRFEEELNMADIRDRRTRRSTDHQRLDGVATPTVIREERQTYVDTWNFNSRRF